MSPLVNLVQIVLTVFGFLVVIRALLSWAPSLQESEFGRLIAQITEPVLEPVRRLLPPLGGLDLSPMITVLVIFSVVRVLNAFL